MPSTPSIPLSFAGKRALVTGAAGGIGSNITKALARAGAHVLALDLNATNLAELQRQWSASDHVQSGKVVEGAGISIHTIDVGDWDATRALVQSLLPIELCVNCAGINDPNGRTPFVDLPIETFRLVHRVNVEATLNITQIVARSMIEGAKSRSEEASGTAGKRSVGSNGAIVNISSMSSNVSWPGYMAYCPSKASVDMVSRVAARELGEYNIRVNTVNPGITMTELGRRQWLDPQHPERVKPLLERMPMGRFCEVDEVTNAVMYLLSDYASMITGQQLVIDGGYTA